MLVAGWGVTCAGATELPPDQVEFFEKNIRPVLVEHCYKCHSVEAKKLKGGLAMDSRDGLRKGGDSGPAVVPGKPKESLLLKAVGYTHEGLRMPPKGKLPAGKALPIAKACMTIAGERFEKATAPEDTAAVFRARLMGGTKTELHGWFKDANGTDVCGSFYARVKLIGAAGA